MGNKLGLDFDKVKEPDLNCTSSFNLDHKTYESPPDELILDETMSISLFIVVSLLYLPIMYMIFMEQNK